MAKRKKIVKRDLPPDLGTLNAAVRETAEMFTNIEEEATFRITRSVIQNKLENDMDWKDGMNKFREKATLDIAKIDNLEGYMHRNVELLLKKVLILEEKVERLSNG
jgi:hypothetical protein